MSESTFSGHGVFESENCCVSTFNRRDPSISVESINFRQFVRTLARFKRESKGHEHEMNTREKKLDCELCLIILFVLDNFPYNPQ